MKSGDGVEDTYVPRWVFFPKLGVPRQLCDSKTLDIQSSGEYSIGTFVWRVTYEQKIKQ